jgi:hypothetical protein
MISERPTSFEEAREELLRPLPIHPNTLGRMVVEAANVETIVEVRAGQTDDEYTQGYRDYTEKRLAEVRSDLAGLSETKKAVVENYVSSAAPAFIQGMRKNASISWADWMTGEGIELTDSASNRQLINFLQWHVGTIERQQANPLFNAELNYLRKLYKQCVRDAVEEGKLSEAAAHAVGNIDSTAVYVGDVFMTSMHGWGGLYDARKGDVAIKQAVAKAGSAQESEGLVDSLNHYFFHEETHAEIESFHAGSPLNASWFREAMDEHISASLREGEFDIVAPDERTSHGTKYTSERHLLDAILNLGSSRINPTVAARAFSGTLREQEDFLNMLDESWGMTDFLPKINSQVSSIAVFLKLYPDAKPTMAEGVLDHSKDAGLTKEKDIALAFTAKNLSSLYPLHERFTEQGALAA